MTVGELVFQQAIKDGYNPALPEGFVSRLSEVAKTYQRIFETMREPIKTATSIVERMQPQLDIIRKISLPTLPPIPSSLYDALEREETEPVIYPMFKTVQDVRIVNAEDMTFAPTRRAREFSIDSYLLPQNAKWESLDVQFIDGHIVKVSYPNMESKKFDYKDMGFMNAKTNNPDRKWELLREMAGNSGALNKERWDRRFSRNVKYELNEQLKEFFGMKENPIPHYTKKHGYRARFTLRGER